MDTVNYMKLRKFSLRYGHYMIGDTAEYLADGLFIQEKVRVDFGSEYAKRGTPYLMVFCRVGNCKKNVMEIPGTKSYTVF